MEGRTLSKRGLGRPRVKMLDELFEKDTYGAIQFNLLFFFNRLYQLLDRYRIYKKVFFFLKVNNCIGLM